MDITISKSNEFFDVSVRNSDIVGDGDYASSIAFSGIITTKIDHIEVVSVYARIGSELLGRGNVFPSGVVEKSFGFGIRFSKFLYEKLQTISLWVELSIVGERKDILFSEILFPSALNIDVGGEVKYSPILVTGMGRSGTTLFMSCFSSHPEIAVPGNYPFEFRQASYLWHSVRVLTSPADFTHSMHPDSFEGKNPTSIGNNPYIHRDYAKHDVSPEVANWQDRTWSSEYVKFVKGQVDNYIGVLTQSQGKKSACFFAEKTIVSPMNTVVRNIYPDAREIFLVRDFRDSYVSAREFNKKRNSQSFEREDFTNDHDWLKSRKIPIKYMADTISGRKDRYLIVKYENLLIDIKAELNRVFSWLGLSHDANVMESIMSAIALDASKIKTHATSMTPIGSIGRWKTEMSAKEKHIADEAFGEYMGVFGYDRY